jgi:hypothetical protein
MPKEDKLLASIYNNKLYLSEIINSIPQEGDSTEFIKSYIDSWIKKQLLITQAEMNLTDALKDVDERINDYRNSLLIYAYQQELIKQNFDTTVSAQEILSYYKLCQESFELKQNIFKGRFVKIAVDAPRLDGLRKIFQSEKEDDREDLLEYCRQFASIYNLEDTKWVYFSKFAENLPVEVNNSTYYLSSNNYYTYTIDSSKYFLFINEYQIKGGTSPLGLVQEEIRKIILNKNKLQFLKSLEDDLFQQAIANRKIKIYQ